MHTYTMTRKKYYTVRAIPKYKQKIVETGKIDTRNTYTCLLTLLTWNRHFSRRWQG